MMASGHPSYYRVRAGRRVVLGVTALLGVTILLYYAVDWFFSPPTLFRWADSTSSIRIWIDQSIDKPPVICLTATKHGQPMIKYRFIAGRETRQYHFDSAVINEGKLVCIYETELATRHSCWLIIVDFERNECWPPSSYSDLTREALDSWKQRYRFLRQQHPSLPEVSHFDR
jgi:hypothetical protein